MDIEFDTASTARIENYSYHSMSAFGQYINSSSLSSVRILLLIAIVQCESNPRFSFTFSQEYPGGWSLANESFSSSNTWDPSIEIGNRLRTDHSVVKDAGW
jgi:hypothetical protein